MVLVPAIVEDIPDWTIMPREKKKAGDIAAYVRSINRQRLHIVRIAMYV